MRTIITLTSLLLVVAFASAAEPAKPTAEDVAKAQKLVEKKLAELKITNAKPVQVTEDYLAKTLPDRFFFQVVQRTAPPANVVPPIAGKVYHIFAVKNANLEHLKNAQELEAFFKEAIPATKTTHAMRDTCKAFVRLAHDFYQDGFYRFQVMDEATVYATQAKDHVTVTGQAVVMGGGNGEIKAEMVFDKDGKLTEITHTANLKSGPRPICQATKLLDPDPIVRYMAEQSILGMGSGAKDYLDYQRAKASPELQKAIDKMWQRIVEEGR